jgi:hypothetical protein
MAHEVIAVTGILWTRGQVRSLCGSLTAGAIVLTMGYVGASNTVVWSHQLLWAVLAVIGLVIGGVGGLVWLSSAFRTVHRLSAHVQDQARLARMAPSDPRVLSGQYVPGLVTAPRMTTFHRTSCILVRGKDHIALGSEATRIGLSSCGVCQP